MGIKLNDVYEFYVSLKCNVFVNRPAASSFTISYITLGGNFAFSKIKKGWVEILWVSCFTGMNFTSDTCTSIALVTAFTLEGRTPSAFKLKNQRLAIMKN